MVNLSSNLNQSVLMNNNKSKIPIRIYIPKQQTNASITTTTNNNSNINLKTNNKYNYNFKSNSTLNINMSKIPKLTKIMNDSKMETSSVLSTNTFNIGSTDKLLRERKYKRSQSFNTESSINQSSLSAKSTTTASSTSLHSYNSKRNSQDLIKFIRKKLKDTEKSHNFDELSQILCDESKISNNKRIITLEQLRIKYNSKSLPNSQLSHANKLINKFKTSNTPEQETRIKHKHRILEAYFHNLKHLDQYFKSAERELFDRVLQDSTNSTKIKKYQKILRETIEKFNLIINDKDCNNLSLLSPESYATSKQDYYKNGEFILRLIDDLIFKFRICLKLYDKINEINSNYKLPQIQNKITELQNSLENFNNESFIKETDCSSIMSDDDDNDGERDSKNSNKKEGSNPIEDYKQIKKRILLINEDLSDLNMYLDSLNLRAERCSKLEEQLKTDRDLIKKTEINLRKCESSDIKLKSHLEKQLEYLKYKFKVNLQDYNIEKLCAHEIYSAISDTEFKIYKLNSYLQDLNMNLVYCQSKMNLNKTKKYVCNLSDVSKMKNLYPRHLPPIQHTRDLSLQQFH
ncbi:unnamed protein product [Brachionus calyciflorus]|uniref:Uncharacterized protein n=1 Tax=Brachionus calyciflorus TaxID=104777 RepID=A0A814HX20_9BILA|nr:unnamed protein product [Brachionus calyciflorus]